MHAPRSVQAYLRPGLGDDGAMGITDARAYFGAAAPGEESPRHSLCGGEDLLPLTPYARYWQFYRAPDVQGNVYLWDAREAEPLVRCTAGSAVQQEAQGVICVCVLCTCHWGVILWAHRP